MAQNLSTIPQQKEWRELPELKETLEKALKESRTFTEFSEADLQILKREGRIFEIPEHTELISNEIRGNLYVVAEGFGFFEMQDTQERPGSRSFKFSKKENETLGEFNVLGKEPTGKVKTGDRPVTMIVIPKNAMNQLSEEGKDQYLKNIIIETGRHMKDTNERFVRQKGDDYVEVKGIKNLSESLTIDPFSEAPLTAEPGLEEKKIIRSKGEGFITVLLTGKVAAQFEGKTVAMIEAPNILHEIQGLGAQATATIVAVEETRYDYMDISKLPKRYALNLLANSAYRNLKQTLSEMLEPQESPRITGAVPQIQEKTKGRLRRWLEENGWIKG
jgi:hypothetical protein